MLSARVRDRCEGPGEGLWRLEIVAGAGFSARFLQMIKLAVPEQLLEARLWACSTTPLAELVDDCLRRTFGVGAVRAILDVGQEVYDHFEGLRLARPTLAREEYALVLALVLERLVGQIREAISTKDRGKW